MNKNLFIVTLIILVMFIPLAAENGPSLRSFMVETVKVKGTDITRTFDISGKVMANKKIVIKSPFNGIISKVHVIDGEWVTKGEKIITFSRDYIRKMIEANVNSIKKWENTLKQRQNWKVREKSAEDIAKKNIRKLKSVLGKIRVFLKDPVIRTEGEGRVGKISSRGEKVASGSELASIVDDYVMKIKIPANYTKYFFKGMRIDVNFKKEKLYVAGRVGYEGQNLMIFVNNPDLKIRSGMKAVFSVNKKIKDVIMIGNGDFKTDIYDKQYVYISDGNQAVKRFITVEKMEGSGYLVTSGLAKGELLVSPIPDVDSSKFRLIKINNFTNNKVSVTKSASKRPRIKRKSFSLGKKMEFEVSAGLSIAKPESLLLKNTGIDSSVSKYADSFGISQTSTGNFKENLIGIPISFLLNYRLSAGLFLKFGGEFSVMNNSSSKKFTVSWPASEETMDYSLKNSISKLTPFIGIEKRFSSFGIYAILGLNLTSFKHTNTLKGSDGSGTYNSVEEIKANGTDIGINVGIKYMLKFKERFGVVIRLEYAMQNIGSLSGDKVITFSDSYGTNYSSTESGKIYMYDIDPYGEGGFGWWDLHKSSPTGKNISNVNDFSLNLSRIRFLVGFSF